MIARLEAGSLTESMTDFDIGAATSDIVELYEPSAEENGMTVTYAGEPGLTVHADRDLVSRALSNLIENALKYGRSTSPDVASNIRVEARRVGPNVEITVADHGPGIPDANDRARVLDRFVRLEASRSAPGSGLGLSLVAAIARLHKGALRLEDAAPGLRAILDLPAPLATPA